MKRRIKAMKEEGVKKRRKIILHQGKVASHL